MGNRNWSHGYTLWVEKIVREAREAGDTRSVNQIRFDPKYTYTSPGRKGPHYSGPELPQPVPSLPSVPRAEDGHGDPHGGRVRRSVPNSHQKSNTNIPQKEADIDGCSSTNGKSELVKHRKQTIKEIERNRSHQQSSNGSNSNHEPSSSSSSRNSLAKLNMKELRNLVDNPQAATLTARHELDKIMQVKTVRFYS